VADPKSILLLLVEDDPEDEEFLRQAVNEIVESPEWPDWHTCELIPASTLTEALDILHEYRFDAILLNLSLPDTETLLAAFSKIESAAASRPILVLADWDDESLAHTLLRHGAQDVLVKSRIESDDLARALRYAIERQRRVHSLEAYSFFDGLTGLYNRRGFAAFAEHKLCLAHRLGEPVLIGVIELVAPSLDDVDLIRASELLRSACGDGSVLGRTANHVFSVCTSSMTEGGAECFAQRFERELENLSIRVGTTTWSPGHSGGLPDLLEEAHSRLSPKAAMLAH
jgi:two-component system cell cycle response regulator